jgi:nitrite reductase/ring-hydroxylating ferredoxin subunit
VEHPLEARAPEAHGWYQLAFERDLAEPVQALTFARRSLMAVRGPDGVRVFDAVCPHRGAHLGHGGRLDHGAVVCPFHGHRVGLGCGAPERFTTREYAAVVHGGGLFARLSDRPGPDFPAALVALGAGHRFVPGFEMTAETTVEVVIENGFDNAHFRTVHGLLSPPAFAVREGPYGELIAEGLFEIPAIAGAGAHLSARYVGRAFSPGIFIAELDGDPPFRYRIMTTATPAAGGACTIRLTLMLPEASGPGAERFAEELMAYSRDGLERDRAIWNRLDHSHVPQLTPQVGAAAPA